GAGGRGVSASVFVMSDVVGSTGLWEAHGEDMREALETHDRLVHGAIEASGGRVFKHTGDGMIAVFNDVDDAVAGSIGAVKALADGSWGPTGALEIRVSVHAGSASERDGDFFGPPVNKVARINGVGHGGQVLVSDVARQLMSQPAGTDLGVHQLRDLSEPVQLWQLDSGVHPALRTLKKARHNLPVMPTEFIGRQAEVDELRALVDHHRIVTISGVGGCGKTRLAIEVAAASADKFPGGVWFVDLTTERDGDKVGDRAIGALGLFQQLGSDGGGPIDVLNEATTGAATLLVIDNCEHLIDDVADFAAEVLTSATAVTVLATSRESLNVDGERAWRIPNMHDAAVELFVDRATAAGVTGLDNRHAQIEDICAQLDDIPLAIELAAARLTSLSIDELTERLDDRFSLLGGGRSRRRQRQQTLQTMMDWSYGLLDDDERQVLNQLAVFAGTFSLSGVDAVVESTATSVLDVMDSLVEQSLVVASVDSGRYRLLETVRLYALDRLLNTDQLAAIRDRHLAWMDALSGREFWPSVAEGETWEAAEQQLAEVANALAAMEWAEQTNQNDALLSLYIGGQTTWASTGSLVLSWLDRIPEPPVSEPNLRSGWLSTTGDIRVFAGDDATGYTQLLEAAAIVDELIAADQPFTPSFSSLIALTNRGIFLAMSDVSAALAESDRMSELQVDGEPRIAEYMSLMIRMNVLMLAGDDAALTSVMQTEAVGRTLSRYADDNTVAMKAILLAGAERYEEALAAATQCLNSQVLPQSTRMNSLIPAVESLAALGRYEAALDVVEKDFGPMIDAQRARLMGSQLIALILILHQLKLHERINEIAGIAYAHGHGSRVFDAEVRTNLADIIGGDEAFAALSRPDPAELIADRIASLIDDLITEIRDLIAPVPTTHTISADQAKANAASSSQV
ncbi:adenylate/guanylate cyclase domain-containing protein, partial [bacterium]|nr:adenylate/guanylate cyclase domain-containing protein [bacterium]